MMRSVDEDAKLTPVMRLYAGSIAGIIGMSATYPLDMVRGRLSVQTEMGGSAYRGLFDALIKVTRTEVLTSSLSRNNPALLLMFYFSHTHTFFLYL